jgi:hypothetical protein
MSKISAALELMEWKQQMTQVQKFVAFGFATIAISSFGIQVAAQAADPLAAIQQKLDAQIKLTTTTADRTDIVKPGAIVELRRQGLILYSVASPLPPSNTYKNGSISQGWSGFGKDILISSKGDGSTTAQDYPHRKFVAGEKCWVTSVHVQKDGIILELYSDPYDDVRYYGNLKIPFAKNSLPPPDAAMQMVADVLSISPSSDDQGVQSAQQATPASPQAPLQQIAPPPPPADAPPPTIALGQTKDQVTAAFGQPARVAKLGVKEIFYYKDMRVTFINGKVSNVD